MYECDCDSVCMCMRVFVCAHSVALNYLFIEMHTNERMSEREEIVGIFSLFHSVHNKWNFSFIK